MLTTSGVANYSTTTGFLPFSILTEKVGFHLRYPNIDTIDIRGFSIDLVNNNITFTGTCNDYRCIPQKILGYKGFM